jgi:hypothetical protein
MSRDVIVQEEFLNKKLSNNFFRTCFSPSARRPYLPLPINLSENQSVEELRMEKPQLHGTLTLGFVAKY